jgi:hypothetical protein
MKKKTLVSTLTCFIAVFVLNAQLQINAGFVPGNRTLSASLEKNLLFNATTRYTVTQSGVQAYTSDQLSSFFDGAMLVQYSQSVVTPSNNLVITIEGLPYYHTQVGAWVGFSTRYWPAKSFKIEGYNVWLGANTWVTLADVNSNVESQYVSQVVPGEYTKLRFTFREGAPDGVPVNTMGLSEIFFIHPEAVQAYDGLLVKANGSGNVGIGTSLIPSGFKLAVAGKIITEEVVVKLQSNWPDYVFNQDYNLRPLHEVKQFVKTNKHLPNIPSATEMEENGLSIGEMQNKLLQKIEELTLYIIELENRITHLETKQK